MSTPLTPTVQATRYTVSVLPVDDINHRYYALHVELIRVGPTRRAVWVVHDKAGGYDLDGHWTPGISSGAEFRDVEDALAVARRLAPRLIVNGRTVLDAYRRTHPAASGSGGSSAQDGMAVEEDTPTAPAQSTGRVVAYRMPERPLMLLCRQHAEDWPAELTPVASEDLPDGGICTWHDCGRDVLADA